MGEAGACPPNAAAAWRWRAIRGRLVLHVLVLARGPLLLLMIPMMTEDKTRKRRPRWRTCACRDSECCCTQRTREVQMAGAARRRPRLVGRGRCLLGNQLGIVRRRGIVAVVAAVAVTITIAAGVAIAVAVIIAAVVEADDGGSLPTVEPRRRRRCLKIFAGIVVAITSTGMIIGPMNRRRYRCGHRHKGRRLALIDIQCVVGIPTAASADIFYM